MNKKIHILDGSIQNVDDAITSLPTIFGTDSKRWRNDCSIDKFSQEIADGCTVKWITMRVGSESNNKINKEKKKKTLYGHRGMNRWASFFFFCFIWGGGVDIPKCWMGQLQWLLFTAPCLSVCKCRCVLQAKRARSGGKSVPSMNHSALSSGICVDVCHVGKSTHL